MRNNREMMDLILGVANKDERIRAVYMNGSRTNSNAPRDIFQDYDIVYVVTETASFIKDEKWINVFGDLLIIQEPEKLSVLKGEEIDLRNSYGYLMLFKDGNRIDLHIDSMEYTLDQYGKDSLTIPLLDKDGMLPSISQASDVDYHVKEPTEARYLSRTNNFWWCSQNVAKGIYRNELPYAKQMFEMDMRDALDDMVAWWIGCNNDFKVSPGKMGKYFRQYLPDAYWDMYRATYSDGDFHNFWGSIFIACDLFRILAKDVAACFSFSYPTEDDANMTAYLQRVKSLPADANEIMPS